MAVIEFENRGRYTRRGSQGIIAVSLPSDERSFPWPFMEVNPEIVEELRTIQQGMDGEFKVNIIPDDNGAIFVDDKLIDGGKVLHLHSRNALLITGHTG